MINSWKLIGCEKNPHSAQINRSIRCLNGVSLAEHFRYTIVTPVNGVSYGGWILKEEELEKTNFVKILQFYNLTNKTFGSANSFLSLIYRASTKTSVFLLTRVVLE